ncbi:zinc finger protein 121-like [Periophthalmus magnuspinnatus]|uniref:zinc finger protein 121-like n=1 Tax=Periophthalmus magnuspinnatus TaxID=409849 RepID=UPI002436B78A|nr:zinc finger protein 121-like [Periophthalmus magnuspinnatus]
MYRVSRSVPNDGCVKTEESSLPQRKETDHREDTQGEDISTETHVHREDTQGEDISSQTRVHREDTQGEDINSDTDIDEDWCAPISYSAAQMETEADGDHYNQVQMRAKSTTAPNSGLSPKYKSAPETRATVDNGDVSGTAEGVAEKKHQCSVCKKRFGFKNNLKRHFRVHRREKPYSCSVCEKTFTQKSTLTDHMRTHTGDKPYSCSICEKAFTLKNHLKDHMRTHTGDKPYSCSVCEKAFTLKSTLTSHMRTHTGDKPYSCSVCEKAFTLKSTLTSHMRTHTRDKPYSCSVCEKAFTLKSTLTSHMRTHTGDKPYSCSVCEKAFTKKSHLTGHMRTHTGDRPYSCSVCEKAFTKTSYLTKHIRIHKRQTLQVSHLEGEIGVRWDPKVLPGQLRDIVPPDSGHSGVQSVLSLPRWDMLRTPLQGGVQEPELQSHQESDAVMSRVAFYVKRKQRPFRCERAHESRQTLRILKQWDGLAVLDGILHHVTKDLLTKHERFQFVVPEALKSSVLSGFHDNGGHQGQPRTLSLARQHFLLNVRNYVKQCLRCVLSKTPEPSARAPLENIKTSLPMEMVCIDFWSAEDSNKSVDVLVVKDHFTKLAHAFPCCDQSAKSVLNHCDQCPSFESELVVKLLDIREYVEIFAPTD